MRRLRAMEREYVRLVAHTDAHTKRFPLTALSALSALSHDLLQIRPRDFPRFSDGSRCMCLCHSRAAQFESYGVTKSDARKKQIVAHATVHAHNVFYVPHYILPTRVPPGETHVKS